MAFVVVYDACVLYPAPLRDLLIRIALTGIVRARWSDEILDECFRSILKSRPDLKPHALSRTRRLMTEAVADCIVTGHESLINGLNLPDPNDRHVLAAAIQAGAQSIVTLNLKDFPSDTLAAYNVEAVHPDEFIYDLLTLGRALWFPRSESRLPPCGIRPQPPARCSTRSEPTDSCNRWRSWRS